MKLMYELDLETVASRNEMVKFPDNFEEKGNLISTHSIVDFS